MEFMSSPLSASVVKFLNPIVIGFKGDVCVCGMLSIMLTEGAWP